MLETNACMHVRAHALRIVRVCLPLGVCFVPCICVFVCVHAQIEMQKELLGLLQHEHKILESIFPRHVIEYLTVKVRVHRPGLAWHTV